MGDSCQFHAFSAGRSPLIVTNIDQNDDCNGVKKKKETGDGLENWIIVVEKIIEFPILLDRERKQLPDTLV